MSSPNTMATAHNTSPHPHPHSHSHPHPHPSGGSDLLSPPSHPHPHPQPQPQPQAQAQAQHHGGSMIHSHSTSQLPDPLTHPLSHVHPATHTLIHTQQQPQSISITSTATSSGSSGSSFSSSSSSSSMTVSSPPPAHEPETLRPTSLPSVSVSPSRLTPSDRSVSTPVLPRPLETYHLAYLYSGPLVSRSGVGGPPSAIKQLGFEKEQQSLLKTLETARKAITLRMEVATSTNLSTLVTMGCRALHYTGHGKPTCLAFEDGVGQMHAMDAPQLKRLFEAGGRAQSVKFVFVSACYSEAAGKAFAAAGVPHVIAVKCDAQLADRSAQLFTTQLYLALLVGHTVRDSFEIAREAVQADPNVARADEPKKFLLLPADGNHDVAIFRDIEDGPYRDESSPPKPHELPSIPENFQGRNFLLQQIVEKCVRKRLVSLTGEAGIGKTALAIAAGHYVWKRSLFDGVFFVELSRWSSQHRSLASLCSEACHMSPVVHDMSQLIHELRGRGKKYLIILDGADALAGEEREGPRCVKTFINQLMHNSSVHVLVTSLSRVGDIREVPEQEIPVTPLAPNDASQLFWDLAPRTLALSEFGCTDPLMAGQCLSQHPALKLVAGHPGRIFKAAQLLAEAALLDDLPDLIRQYETAASKSAALSSPPSKKLLDDDSQASTAMPPTHSHTSSATSPIIQHPITNHMPHIYPTYPGATHPQHQNPFPGGFSSPFTASPNVSPNANPNSNSNLNTSPHPHSHIPHPVPSNPPFEHTLRAFLPDLEAQLVWRSFGERMLVSWQELDVVLCNHFMQRAGPVERNLSHTDRTAIHTRLDLLSSQVFPNQVQLAAFAQFWPWFTSFEATIRKVAPIWNTTQPHLLIHGLMSRTQAADMLRTRPVGTFLLRFSETSAGCIAVAFVDGAGAVQHTLIDTRGSGYKIVLTDGEREYETLPELIMKCRPMICVYPGIPKEEAFSPPDDQPH